MFFKKIIIKIVSCLPFRTQKAIYLFWYYLKHPLFFFNKPISTKKMFLSEKVKKTYLVGFLKVYNELEKGNLTRVLRHMKMFCDDIVVCDCSSTDNSLEVIRKFTKHILVEPNNFKDELFVKQKMLDYALKLKPDWIVWLDADEVFDRQGEFSEIRKLCFYGDRNNIDGFSFLEYNLWKDKKHYRKDGSWNKAFYVRLWKNTGFLRFQTQRGLHFSQHPVGLKNIKTSTIKVIHYGFSTIKLIKDKYQKYKEEGQSGYRLERICSEKGLKLGVINLDWFPISTFRVSVVCLVYKSIDYIKLVWGSFNKHTKNADFLFIANDASPEVKKYLKENNLPHLIFENKDKKEYYLKRVYRAWNFGGFNASADIIVFVNSDMAFSRNWLSSLLINLKKNRIVCSRLVESGKLLSGQYAMSKNFGRNYKEYKDDLFQNYVEKIKIQEIKKGGLFMPCAIYKDLFVESGGYPIGNRRERSGHETSGDYILFYEKLKPMGIDHYTVFNSIVYHIQEGEMDE